MENQETINLDIENIASKNQQVWRSIYEFIYDSYFGVVNLFPTTFLNQCKKIQMNFRTYQMKSRKLLKMAMKNVSIPAFPQL